MVVTGSSRGIGRAIALEAAKRGARGVVVNYRSDEEGAHRTIALLKSYGVDAIAVRADVGVWGEARRVIDEAIERYGGVDVLVNNAGILAPKPFREMEPREWEDMFRVHVFGSMNMARAALEYMREGVIVNIASILAVRPEAEASHYSAAKAALVAWTIALAKELAPAIRIFAVLPGGVDTRMARVWAETLDCSFLYQTVSFYAT